MRLKRVLLATTALALLSGAPAAQAGELYISVFGGANFLTDTSGIFDGGEGSTTAFETNADTGFVIGGAIGTHLDKWVKGLRVELEASYRRNDVKGNWFSNSPSDTTGTLDGNVSTFAIMANAWYDIDIGSKVKPYVGGGAGWGRMHGDFVFISSEGDTFTNTQEHSGFAWQLGAGFHYEVAPDVNVGLGYRYFNGPDFTRFFDGKSRSPDLKNDSHAVMVDLTIGIN